MGSDQSHADAVDMEPLACPFCPAAADDLARRTVLADETTLVVRDIRPAARVHLLVCPRMHIRDVHVLTAQPRGAALLRHMLSQGKMALRAECDTLGHTLDEDAAMFGFHVPPYLSVPHLHLHVLLPPFGNCCKARKYMGFWFAEANSLLADLEERQGHGGGRAVQVDTVRAQSSKDDDGLV
jgi:diadenosine tetraphosphate (Ap4A) HIT family hydrolase